MLDLAKTLRETAGSDMTVEFAPHRPGEQQESFVNVDKAKAIFGWTPEVSLEQGLSTTYQWFAAQVSGTAV